jgi:threonine synthase
MNDPKETGSLATRLVCSNCQKEYPIHEIANYATCCNQPLFVEYDLKKGIKKSSIDSDRESLWRYRRFLPVFEERNIVTLGEGMTPLISLDHLANKSEIRNLLIKDESLNPTDSFKARGMSLAVSKCKELGIQRVIIPTAGNAGVALAAYASRAGLKSCIVMPTHTPAAFMQECKLYGAELISVNGFISDCARKVEEIKESELYFDVSTLKEPYRIEGKKTMGYEIAEQLNWDLPDFIICPTGGGTGLIGIWKAFHEMHSMGWIGKQLPKMIAVQSQHCNPISRSMHDPENWKRDFSPKSSVANGLTVPFPFGLKLIHRVLKESGGTVFDVSEEEIISGVKELAENEGLFVAPEGAAGWKAFSRLRQLGVISGDDKVLLLNTGSGFKYLENLDLN